MYASVRFLCLSYNIGKDVRQPTARKQKKIHVDVWQKPTQYCKKIILQLKENNSKKVCAVNLILCSHVCMLSHALCNPWTVALQAPLSMGFSRQEYWNRLPCPPSDDLPNSGIEPVTLMSPALASRFFTTSTTLEAPFVIPPLYPQNSYFEG